MIAALTGILEVRSTDAVIINVSGVSFRVFVSAPTLRQCGGVGERIVLYTYLLVREDAWQLYGFLSSAERDFFERLLAVSGVGPKLALSLLSAMTLPDLEDAIARGDIDALTRIPGIGKKTGARLVLELKGKIDLSQLGTGRRTTPPAEREVLDALTNLGYPLPAAQEAVQRLPADPALSSADKIRLALRFLASR